ncbi:S46 family peptidase, partial [candidate division KSB1 bacterium]|nr:S46 family peptidase [candidate division KSB1 bacterium]
WLYNTELQRMIAVDVRYVLFITEKFAGAEYLIKEMGW